jgi:hypothetical protein
MSLPMYYALEEIILVQTRGKSRSERLSRLTFRSCRRNTRPRYKRPRPGDDGENHKISRTLDVRQRTTWPCSGQAEDDCPMWLNRFSMKRGKYPMIETSVHESGDTQKERLTIKLGQVKVESPNIQEHRHSCCVRD